MDKMLDLQDDFDFKKRKSQNTILNIMLRYLSDSDTNTKDKNDSAKKESEEVELEVEETELEIEESSKTEDNFFLLHYSSFDENQGGELEYNTQIHFYNLYQKKLYNELAYTFPDNDGQRVVANAENYETESYSAEEAKKTLEEAQYSSLLGVDLVDNYEEYRKLNQWILFNPALFALFQSVYNLNRDVDYRPPA